MRILSIFGTRPEAIKMAPVINLLEKTAGIESRVCTTGQHREMLNGLLDFFNVRADHNLNIMKPHQDLIQITQAILSSIGKIINEEKPTRVLVHGDTTTTFAGALAAFYLKIPVGHIEAGLRTGNIHAPFPEEINRKFTDTLCDLHFAPTQNAANNLLNEGIDSSKISITGNTGIDALFHAVKSIRSSGKLEATLMAKFPFLATGKRIILVTGHRRENFGRGFEQICAALDKLSTRNDVEIVYPVHLNPNVQEPVHRILGHKSNIHLLEPLDYLPFVFLMEKCYLIITDSGGVQEEAPSLGKPVLTMRDVSERPEAIEKGTVKLVGTDSGAIINETNSLLDNPKTYADMCQVHNPYGDGKAASRIVREIRRYHDK